MVIYEPLCTQNTLYTKWERLARLVPAIASFLRSHWSMNHWLILIYSHHSHISCFLSWPTELCKWAHKAPWRGGGKNLNNSHVLIHVLSTEDSMPWCYLLNTACCVLILMCYLLKTACCVLILMCYLLKTACCVLICDIYWRQHAVYWYHVISTEDSMLCIDTHALSNEDSMLCVDINMINVLSNIDSMMYVLISIYYLLKIACCVLI